MSEDQLIYAVICIGMSGVGYLVLDALSQRSGDVSLRVTTSGLRGVKTGDLVTVAVPETRKWRLSLYEALGRACPRREELYRVWRVAELDTVELEPVRLLRATLRFLAVVSAVVALVALVALLLLPSTPATAAEAPPVPDARVTVVADVCKAATQAAIAALAPHGLACRVSLVDADTCADTGACGASPPEARVLLVRIGSGPVTAQRFTSPARCDAALSFVTKSYRDRKSVV